MARLSDRATIPSGRKWNAVLASPSLEEIESNRSNLNIPCYVDTSEPEPEIDIHAMQNETRAEMNRYLVELGIDV